MFESVFKAGKIGFMSGDKCPVFRGMIELAGMAKLVKQELVHQFNRQKQELGVEADGPSGRATPPPGFLAAHTHGRIVHPETAAHGVEQWKQGLPRLAGREFSQDFKNENGLVHGTADHEIGRAHV